MTPDVFYTDPGLTVKFLELDSGMTLSFLLEGVVIEFSGFKAEAENIILTPFGLEREDDYILRMATAGTPVRKLLE